MHFMCVRASVVNAYVHVRGNLLRLVTVSYTRLATRLHITAWDSRDEMVTLSKL